MAHTNTQLSQWLESKVYQTLDIRKGEFTIMKRYQTWIR